MNGILEKVIDKVRKLLAKSRGTDNEFEALTFAEKAHALLAENNLSLSDVEKQEAAVVVGRVIKRTRPWTRAVRAGCGLYYFCGYFYAQTTVATEEEGVREIIDAHCFVGSKANVDVALLMAEYLEQAGERIADQASAKIKKEIVADFRESFLNAYGDRVYGRLRDMTKVAATSGVLTWDGSKLPALLNQYDQAQDQFNEWASAKGIVLYNGDDNPIKSKEGWLAGAKAGREVSLNTQVGSEDPNKGLASN